jgi:hypothetical protein
MVRARSCDSHPRFNAMSGRTGLPALGVLALLVAATACGGAGPEEGASLREAAFDPARLPAGADLELLGDPIPLAEAFYGANGVSREHEVTSARTATSYTFQRPDGSRLSVIGSGLENYVDEAGRYRPIDRSITPFDEAPPIALGAVDGPEAMGTEAAKAFANTTNNPRTYFPEDPAEGVLVAFDTGDRGHVDVAMRWTPTRRTLDLPGGQDVLSVATGVTGTVHGDRMRYEGTYPGVIEEYVVQAGRLKHDILLLEPPAAPARKDGYLSFEGTLALSPGLVPYVDGVARVEDFETTAPIELRDHAGTPRFRLGRPYAYERDDPSVESEVAYRVTLDPDGGITLALATPLAWLLDPERVYPVVIDPSPETLVSSYSVRMSSGTASKSEADPAYIGRGSGLNWRSAFKFPLLDVPAHADVDAVTLQLNVTTAVGGHTARIGRVASDPQIVDGPTLYAEIDTGTLYHESSSIGAATGTRSQLLPNAVADVQAEVALGGWIALGLKHTTEGTNAQAAVSAASAENEANRPRLIVDYTLPDEALVFTRQPPLRAYANVPFQVEVTVIDPAYEAVTGYGQPVSLELENAGGGETLRLGGSTNVTVTPVNGVAVFDGLTLDAPGGPYRLRAVSGDLKDALSSQFEVLAEPVTILKVGGDGQVGAMDTDLDVPLVLEIRDDEGNPLRDVPLVWSASGDAAITGMEQTLVNGRASAEATLGSLEGGYGFTASVPGTDLIVTFSASATPPPIAVGPIAYALVETDRPTFRFRPGNEASPFAAGFALQWDTSPTFDAPTTQAVGAAPAGGEAVYTLSPGQALNQGQTYYWRVRGVDGGGVSGPWSEVRSLTVDTTREQYGWHLTSDWQLRRGEMAQARVWADAVSVGFSSTPQWSRDFEDGTLGGFTVGASSGPFGACSGCAVSNTDVASYSGTRSLRFLKPSSVGWIRITHPDIGTMEPTGRLVYRTMRSGGTAGQTFFSPTFLADDAYNMTSPIHLFGTTQTFRYGEDGATSEFVPPALFFHEQWHTVEIEWQDRLYDVTIDGELRLSGEPFAADGDPTGFFGVAYSGLSTWYLDDLELFSLGLTGTWYSPPVSFADRPEGTGNWGSLAWTKTEPAAGSTVTLQVEHSSDGGDSWALVPNVDLSGNATGLASPVDLGGLDPSAYPLLRARVSLARAGTADPVPELHDLTLSWEEAYSVGTHLAFTTAPQTALPGECSEVIEVRVQDDMGGPASVSFDTTVHLSASVPSLTFHTAADCGEASQISSVVIPDGQVTATFYVRDTKTGASLLTAAASGLDPADLDHTVWPPEAPVALAFTTAPPTVTAGDCSLAIGVEVQDEFGNTSIVESDTVVSLASVPDSLTFHAGATCAGGISQVTIPAGASAATFYLQGTTTGDYQVTADTLGLDPATLAVVIVAGLPSAGGSTIAANPTAILADGDSTSTITVQLRDAAGNPLTQGLTAVYEEFETGAPNFGIGHLVGGGSDFEIGVPTSGPGSAFSGQQCAATVLDGPYTNDPNTRLSYLRSPIRDLSHLENPILRFHHWHDIETTYDGANLKLSVDGGISYFQIDAGSVTPAYSGTVSGNFGNPLAGQLAWWGTSGGWTEVVVDLNANLQGLPRDQVVVRFDFGADHSVNAPGWYIDDVYIGNEGGFPVSMTTTAGTLSSVRDRGDGTYTATLTSSTVLGTATVTGFLYGELIGAVDVAFVASQPSPETSTITANPTSITANGEDVSVVTVQLKDQNGLDVTDGGYTVALFTNHGMLSSVVDNGDGTYTATLTATSTGTATITGTLGGEAMVDTATVQVNPVPLTVTAPSPTVTYGDAAPTLTPSYDGFVAGDGPGDLDVQPTCTTAYAAGDPAGTYATQCGGGADSRYTFIYVDGTLTVAPAVLTVTAPSPTITYGDAAPTLTPSYAGFVAGDGPSDLTTEPTCTTPYTAGDPVGTYGTACSGGASGNYTFDYVDGTLTVEAKALTITAADATKTYGETHTFDETADFIVTGLEAGDSVDTVSLSSAGAAAGADVGTYDIVASNATGSGLSNYTLSYQTGTLTVEAKALTITAADATKTYGETHTFDETADFIVTGLEAGDSVDTVSLSSAGAAAGADVGTYDIVASGATGSGLANYDITYQTGTLTVSPAVLTVTAPSPTITYGDDAPALTPIYDGFVGGDGPADLTTQPTCTTAYGAGDPAGTYVTECSGGVSGNYTFDYVDGTLTVEAKALTITARDQNKTYGETFVFDETADFIVTGLEPGDSVDTVSLTSAGAAADADLGTYAIVASNATGTGLSNYAITYQTGTLTVVEKALTLTATDATKTYGDVHVFDGTADFIVSGLEPGDSVESVTLMSAGAAAGAAVGTYDIVISDAVGTGLENYTILYQVGTLTVEAKALTVTAADATKTYGDTHLFDETADFLVSGLEPGDSVDGVTLTSAGAAAGASVGTYDIVASNATGTGLSNYEITYQTGTLTVGVKALSIRANDASKTYGQVHVFDEAEDFTAIGLEPADSVDGVTLSSDGAAANAEVGTYDILVSDATGSGLSNYDITYETGTLTVVPAAADELVFVTDPQTVVAGVCSAVVTLRTEDAFGNASAVEADAPIALSADSGMTFFTDAGCTSPTTTVTVLAGTSTASFYFRDTTAGLPTLTADGSPGLPSRDQVQNIVPAQADASRSTITAADAALVADGISTTTVTVRARDAFDNALTEGGHLVCLTTSAGTLSGDRGSCGPGEVEAVDQDDGRYEATLTSSTDASEAAEITGTLDGALIGDTAIVEFLPGDPRPETTTITAVPEEIVADGVEASVITVQLKDENGSDLFTGGSLVCLSTSLGTLSGDPGACGPGEVQAVDNGDGTHTATLTATVTGTAVVSGTLEGQAIADTAEVTVVPGAPWIAEITGPSSALAGEVATLDVQVRDQNGNAVPASLELSLVLSGSASGSIEATRPASPDTPGQTVSVSTTAAGGAEIDVLDTSASTVTVCASGPDLGGAPSCHEIVFGAAAADHIRITAATGTTVAGEPETLTLEVSDAYGNRVAEAVTVTLAAVGSAGGAPTLDGAAVPATVVTGSDGLLAVDLIDTTAETVTVTVDAAIGTGGSALPATTPHGEAVVVVVAGPAHRVIVIAPEEAVAGEETEVTVQVVDAYGNLVEEAAEVCVTATGDDGGEPTMGPDAEPGDPATACTTTGAGTGTGSLTLTATKAEAVALSAESTGLPGSGSDEGATVIIVPAAPDHLRLTPEAPEGFACEALAVEVQVVDAYDNPVEIAVEVTLTVDAPGGEGDPRIVEAELDGLDPAQLPAGQITADTDASGWARIVVILDAEADLEIGWSAAALPGDPAGYGATVAFGAGPANAALSEVSAERAQVSTSRSTTVTVTPLDACGLPVGPGATVVLDDPGAAGSLSGVVDEGDGTYTAEFTATGCPMTAEIGATVDGVRLDASATIETLCLEADPDLSTVTTVEDTVLACASQEIGALIEVVLLDEDGEDLGPDFFVEVDGDEPFVVPVGEPDWDVDPETGHTVHRVRVGSNRCGDAPRAIHFVAGGVTLNEPAWVTFTCPDVDPAFAHYEASPARAPANGTDAVSVTAQARDVCGNPAFGREVRLAVTAEQLGATVSPEAATAIDDPDAPTDGSATFEIRSRLAGTSGVVATVDGVVLPQSEEDLVVFSLEDVLSVGHDAHSRTAVVGQIVRFTTTLESHYGAALTGLRLSHEHEGLVTLRADGATLEDDGTLTLARLEAESTHEITIEARVTLEAAAVTSRIAAWYGVDGLDEQNLVRSPTLRLEVGGRNHAHGCECGAAGGGSTSLFPVMLLFGLILLRPRRPSRKALASAARKT